MTWPRLANGLAAVLVASLLLSAGMACLKLLTVFLLMAIQ